MVSFFNLIDLFFIVLIFYFSKVAYEHKYYIKFFEYFKLFVVLLLSSKLAPFTGLVLEKLFILKTDTYITLILIAFGLNFLIIYNSWKYFIRTFNHLFSSQKLKIFFAKSLSFLEVLIVFSLGLYLVMQIYIIKINLVTSLEKTYTYPIIARFYHKFLNNNILKILQGSSTGTNQKEILFKSFTNSI